MSLVIRLSKTGKKGERKYRVVVQEKRSKKDGKSIESLGWYTRAIGKDKHEINRERFSYWLSQGAKASPTVTKLYNA